jgi:D-psicose/D-tagatose/L-ribulose 3-epimerase
MYDTFHANIEEKHPIEAIGAIRRHLSHVHIAENDRGTPGRGHIDFAAAFRALKGSGYDGWLTIEAFGRPAAVGRGDARLARFLPDADASLSRGLQRHSQWLGR